MSKTPAPKDRFDELPADNGRIGAHRAENPRLRGGAIVLWSIVAVVVLVAAGIFGTLLTTGRIVLFPTPTPTPTVVVTADPVIDTTYPVTVLNATPQQGLASAYADRIIAAGWSADNVNAGEAGSDDFPTTSVYYAKEADEGAARGLAEAIGGADVVFSDAYQGLLANPDDPAAKQLVVVIGLNSTDGAAETPAP